MRAVIQRVLSANASADGRVISSIEKGLCVLIGISRNDTKKDIEYIVRKILNLKLFEDSSGKNWSKSVKDCNGEILCLSQVTLYNSFKGNKLDFHHAMAPDHGKIFYNEFLEHIRNEYKPELVKEGIFGAHLVIGIQNDGPVTITLESLKGEEKTDGMEQHSSASKTTKSKKEIFQKAKVIKQDSISSQTCLMQDSTSSQTCLTQDSTSSQTVGYSESINLCSQTDQFHKGPLIKQGNKSSQTCIVKPNSAASQTCLVKQDSASSQTCIIEDGSQTSSLAQAIKKSLSTAQGDIVINQDTKFSQTVNIVQSTTCSQTSLIKQDSVSSQTCTAMQEAIPTSVTTQTAAVNFI